VRFRFDRESLARLEATEPLAPEDNVASG